MLLEFECDTAARETILRTLLVNPSGRKGHFKEGDLLQEHLINRLDRIMQNKDKAYSDRFIRDVVSPNLDSFNEIARQLEASVHLAARSNAHTSMHHRPEMRRLLQQMQLSNIHRFHSGRSSGFAMRDTFSLGLQHLQTGGLAKFLDTHQRETRVLHRASAAGAEIDAEAHTLLNSLLAPAPQYSCDDELGPTTSGSRPAMYLDGSGLCIEDPVELEDGIVQPDDRCSDGSGNEASDGHAAGDSDDDNGSLYHTDED